MESLLCFQICHARRQVMQERVHTQRSFLHRHVVYRRGAGRRGNSKGAELLMLLTHALCSCP